MYTATPTPTADEISNAQINSDGLWLYIAAAIVAIAVATIFVILCLR